MIQATWHQSVAFGLHYDIHAEEHDPTLYRDLTPEILRAAWAKIRPDWVQCDCKGVYGYTSYPTEVGQTAGGLLRDGLRIFRDVTRELGIPLGVHYCGLWDEAALKRHPEWRRIDAAGRPDDQRVCPRSDYVRDLMIPQLMEIVDRYDVDGFWIDGDVWWAKPCHCPRCRDAFHAESGIDEAPRDPSRPGWRWWLDSHRRAYLDYARSYLEAVRTRKPTCLVAINWAYSVLQPEPIDLPVGFLSGDLTPSGGLDQLASETRVLDRRGPSWDIMTWSFTSPDTVAEEDRPYQVKTAAQLCQELAEVIANGGAASTYVQTPRTGNLVGWQHDTLAEVAAFVRARSSVGRGTASVPQAVVLHGERHYYAHNDPLYGLTRPSPGMEGALLALLDSGYHADVANEVRLLERLGDYALVVIAEQDPIDERVIEALTGYVERGGRLVVSGAPSACHPRLARLAGAECMDEPRTGFYSLPVDGQSVVVRGTWQPARPAGATTWASRHRRPIPTAEVTTPASPLDGPDSGANATVWAPLLDGPDPAADDTGAAAITLRYVSRGRIAVAHGPIFTAYYETRYPPLRRLLGQLFEAVWPDPISRVNALGHVVHTLRRHGDRLIVHLLNREASPATSKRNLAIERVPPVGPVTVRLRLDYHPTTVRLVPAEGALTWDWSPNLLTATLDTLAIHTAIVVE